MNGSSRTRQRLEEIAGVLFTGTVPQANTPSHESLVVELADLSEGADSSRVAGSLMAYLHARDHKAVLELAHLEEPGDQHRLRFRILNLSEGKPEFEICQDEREANCDILFRVVDWDHLDSERSDEVWFLCPADSKALQAAYGRMKAMRRRLAQTSLALILLGVNSRKIGREISAAVSATASRCAGLHLRPLGAFTADSVPEGLDSEGRPLDRTVQALITRVFYLRAERGRPRTSTVG